MSCGLWRATGNLSPFSAPTGSSTTACGRRQPIIRADGGQMHEASTGVGPVDALAQCPEEIAELHVPFYPDDEAGRLLTKIMTRNQAPLPGGGFDRLHGRAEIWSVAAISENIIMASFVALLDGFEYAILLKENSHIQLLQGAFCRFPFIDKPGKGLY